MTKTEALKALLEKVEAGDDNLAVLEASCKSEIMFGHAGLYLYVVNAYHGKMTEAERFHNMALSDEIWRCISGPHSLEGGRYHGGQKSYDAIIVVGGDDFEAQSCTPARALLICDLKALIAIEEQAE